MMISFAVLLSAMIAGLSAEGNNCLNADVYEHLDQVLKKAAKELPDPMRLPPRSTIVDLTDGLVWGMSNLTRLGEIEVTCKDENTVLIHTKITTDELKGRYTWTKDRKTKEDREGYVVFITHDFEAEGEVLIQKREGEETHPELKRFRINRFKDARIEITGAGYLSWALGEVTTLMSGIFQRAIASSVQGPLQEALERQLREITIEM